MSSPIGAEPDGVPGVEEHGLRETRNNPRHEYRPDDRARPLEKHRNAIALKGAECKQGQREAG